MVLMRILAISAAACACMLGGGQAAAQTPGGPPGVADFTTPAVLSDPGLSPSGRYLALIRTSGDNSDLYIHDLETEAATALLASSANEDFGGQYINWVRWKGDDLDGVLGQINTTGYGLTLGIHSRIDQTVDYIASRARVGNCYVNRNQIGAVVGVQPFGGQGLSGTGPKAGGPHYLPRFTTEKVITINTTASGGNASLLTLGE